jgi:hypothetical protein
MSDLLQISVFKKRKYMFIHILCARMSPWLMQSNSSQLLTLWAKRCRPLCGLGPFYFISEFGFTPAKRWAGEKKKRVGP